MNLSKNNYPHLVFLLAHFNLQPIIKALHLAGGRCYLVGGTVRDLLRSSSIRDIDIEVYNLSFEQVLVILGKIEFVHEIGKSFGVFKMRNGLVDITLPRVDSSPGRKPRTDFLPHLSLDKALLRRDLTVNSIALDLLTLELHDPYGGVDDLIHHKLRSVDVSFFVEDPLRFWRIFQFIGRFESFVDEKLTTVCRSMDLSELSFDRVEQELIKWAMFSLKPSWSVQWLIEIHRNKLLGSQFLIEKSFGDLDQAFSFFDAYVYDSVHEKIAVRFALLVYYGADLNLITKVNKLRKSVKKLIEFSQACTMLGDYLIAASVLCSLDLTPRTLLFFASAIGVITSNKMSEFYFSLLSLNALFVPIEPIIKSNDLMVLGYSGNILGAKLRQAYMIQLYENLSSKKTILAKICHNS